MKMVKGMPLISGPNIEEGSPKPSPPPPDFMKGPPSLIMNETSQKVIKFNYIVTTISLTLNLPLKNPAIAPNSAPPKAAATNINGISKPGERYGLSNFLPPKATTTAKALQAAAKSCPDIPIFHSPPLKGRMKV